MSLPRIIILAIALVSAFLAGRYILTPQPEAAPIGAKPAKDEKNASPNLALDNPTHLAPDLERAKLDFRQALLNGDSEESRKAIDQALMSLSPENVDDFSKAFNNLPEPRDYRYALETFAKAWAEFDGLSAANFALEEEAAIIIESHAARKALTTWAAYDPDAAKSFVIEYPHGGGRIEAFSSLAHALIARSSTEAIEWAEGQEKQRHKNIASKSLGAALATEDPQLATIWIESMGNSAHAYNAAFGAAYEWAKTDHEGAINWALNNKVRFVGKHALTGALRQWSESNAADAAQWISQADDSLIDDTLLSNFIQGAYKTNPDIALMLVDNLKRDEQKKKLKSLVRDYWQSTDPEDYANRAQDQ